MQTLRNAHLTARLVLVWFALSLGVAIASPIVKPKVMELICSGTGIMKLIVQTDDGATELASHTLDCPLCANLSAPPAVLLCGAGPAFDLPFAFEPLEIARIASLLRGPWQARAPPVFS